MGGPFSAQSADLRCVWMCKKLVGRPRELGEPSVTATGILQWSLVDGNVVASRQFRDNLMVAAKGPSPHTTMYPCVHDNGGSMEPPSALPVPGQELGSGLPWCLHDQRGPLHGGVHFCLPDLYPCTHPPQCADRCMAVEIWCSPAESPGFIDTAHDQRLSVGTL